MHSFKQKRLTRYAVAAALAIAVAGVSFGLIWNQHAFLPAQDGGDHAPTIVAYYLHGTMRCVTCLDIERIAQSAIEERFREALAEGRVEWRSVNYDEPAHEHLLGHYDLMLPSLVLSKEINGREVDWELLDQTWDLCRKPEALRQYIITNVEKWLEANGRA